MSISIIGVTSVLFASSVAQVSAASPETIACPAVTRPLHDVELSFGISGRIGSVGVTRGQRVIAGDPLAKLVAEDIAATVALLSVRASSTSAIESAVAASASADSTLARVTEARAKGASTEKEFEDATHRAEQFRAQLQLERQRQVEALWELKAAKARFDRTVMRATFPGVIEDIRIEAGGAVDELAPVMRLVDDSAFRIDAAVPTQLTMSLRVGQLLEVRYRGLATLAPSEAQYATITALASVADAASRTRVVRLQLKNDSSLPAGLPVEIMVPSTETRVGAVSDPTP